MKFSEALDKAEAWDQENFDELAEVGTLRYGVENEAGILEELLEYTPTEQDSRIKSDNGMNDLFGGVDVKVVEKEKTVSMSHRARIQLTDRVQAPPNRWLFDDARCPLILRAMIVNYKLENWRDQERIFLLRQHGDPDGDKYCRAVLSSIYKKYDHFEYLKAIRTALLMDGTDPDRDFKVERFHIDDRMNMYLSFPLEMDTGLQNFGGGQSLSPDLNYTRIRRGVRISNDETGGGSSRIDPALWAPVCANGMYGWRKEGEGKYVRHVGMSDYAIRVLVGDMIVEALDQTAEFAERFIATQTRNINRLKVGDLIDSWKAKYQLPKSLTENWNDNFSGKPSTLWDHINYLTHEAQGLGYDSGLEVEKMAGRMVYAEIPEKYLEV